MLLCLLEINVQSPDNVLREEGVADFDKYAVKPGTCE